MRRLVLLVSVLILLAAACGGDDGGDGADTEAADADADADQPDDDGDGPEPEPDEPDEPDDDGDGPEPDEPEPERTASWRGVTEDTIRIGVSLLDFDTLVALNLSPAGWGDQIAVWEALVAHINADGGINGRTLEAVYEFYSPIDPIDAERACTVLTLDNEVFAVLGGFLGPLAGTADPCIVGINETILVGGEHTPGELAQARAPWYTTGSSPEQHNNDLLDLLVETGRADGARVFIVSTASAADRVDIVLDALEQRDIEVVGSDAITANDGDTVGQDAELRVIMELVEERGANVIFLNGNPSAPIRGFGNAGLVGEVALWSNNPAALGNLGATIPDKSIANGALAPISRDQAEMWALASFQDECVAVVAAAVPDADLRDPTTLTEEEENWYNPTVQACGNLGLFRAIATAAGVELTHDSFVAGADTLTDFSIPTAPNMSLGPDKITAQDEVRLGEFDHTAGADGGLVPLTELIDVNP